MIRYFWESSRLLLEIFCAEMRDNCITQRGGIYVYRAELTAANFFLNLYLSISLMPRFLFLYRGNVLLWKLVNEQSHERKGPGSDQMNLEMFLVMFVSFGTNQESTQTMDSIIFMKKDNYHEYYLFLISSY